MTLRVPPAPGRTRRPTTVRHPVSVVMTCRELHEGGWGARKIVEIMQRDHGVSVTRDTVRRWVCPEYAEKVAARNERRARKVWAQRWNFRLSGAATSDEYRAAFMRRLRDERVPAPSIAKVCSVVFGQPITAGHVRKVLGETA